MLELKNVTEELKKLEADSISSIEGGHPEIELIIGL